MFSQKKVKKYGVLANVASPAVITTYQNIAQKVSANVERQGKKNDVTGMWWGKEMSMSFLKKGTRKWWIPETEREYRTFRRRRIPNIGKLLISGKTKKEKQGD